MSADVVIVGLGMVTPVGLSTRETAASARSRTARLTSIEWRNNRFQCLNVGRVPDDGLPPLNPVLEGLPLAFRESRMLRLADPAIAQALQVLPKTAHPPAVLVGTTELHATIMPKDQVFLEHLSQQTGVSFDLAASAVFPQGRASALAALREGCERLSQEKAEFVLVGGVDCQIDLFVLGTFDAQKRLRDEMNSDGFAPGEGAGFLLLTTSALAQKHKLNVLAKVVAHGTAKETGHFYSDEPYKGEGLAAAFENLFANVSNPPLIDCVYNTFNGEHYWAKEYGVAMLRNREHFSDSCRTEHPAECFGDLGSAHGSVLLGLAAAYLQRTRTPNATLVSASSDYGDRNVAILTAG